VGSARQDALVHAYVFLLMATGRIINLVWPQRCDCLIETEKDIINGAIAPRNGTRSGRRRQYR